MWQALLAKCYVSPVLCLGELVHFKFNKNQLETVLAYGMFPCHKEMNACIKSFTKLRLKLLFIGFRSVIVHHMYTDTRQLLFSFVFVHVSSHDENKANDA